MTKVKAEDLAEALLKELQEYGVDITEIAEAAIKETAKEAVQKLKRASPKLTGAYRKSWAYKRDDRLKSVAKNRIDMQIYARKPEYRLTHLLENGHAKRGGGRVSGIPHIRKVREEAERKLQERIQEKL